LAWREALVVGALAVAAVVAIHPLGPITHRPYWVDESWVAVLTRAPLHQLTSLSPSAIPLGWLLTLRWFPVGRDSLRLDPLAFTVANVVMAYVFARNLPWRSLFAARFAGALAAAAVALVPIAVVRNDLKQYTCDAFVVLLLFALTSRCERDRRRDNLIYLAVASLLAFPFSTIAVFAIGAVFLGLAIDALVSRDVKRLREVAIAGSVTGVGVLVYYLAVLSPETNPALRNFWRASYLPQHGLAVLGQVWHRLYVLAPALAMPAAVFIGLLIVGSVVLAGLQRRALAIAVPAMWAAFIVSGITRYYPVLDQRTSHFILIMSVAIAAIGAAGIVVAMASRSRVAALLVLAVAGGAFVHSAAPYFRTVAMPNEDVRSQVTYVAAHYEQGDTIVVSWVSKWDFSFYWPGGKIVYSVDPRNVNNATGFFPRLGNVPNVVYTNGRAQSDTDRTVRQATALSRAPHATGRVWVIRTRMSLGEPNAWATTFAKLGLRPETLRVGSEPLLLVNTR
jgi:hypothetical protein